MRTVMQRSGQLMVQYIQALGLRIVRLCKLVKPLLASCIHIFQNVVTQCRNLFARLKLSIKPLAVQYTNQVLLIKVGLINVLHKAGDLGQQLVIIARKIHQRVLALLKQGN